MLMKPLYILIEKLQRHINMKYIITENQKDTISKLVQNFIDSELVSLKKTAESEDSEFSFDETLQIETIESIKVHSVDKQEKWIIYVDVYTPRPLYYYDEILYHISYQLKKHIGPNVIRENQMVITQNFGPGIDY